MSSAQYLLAALTPLNLLLALGGVLAGTLIGALPGLTATMAVAVLVPFTFSMEPASALIALGEDGYLTEVWDLSQGGARLGRPKRWPSGVMPAAVRIYFLLDQETVIRLTARVVRLGDEHVGVECATGQDERNQRLLYEARFLDHAAP